MSHFEGYLKTDNNRLLVSGILKLILVQFIMGPAKDSWSCLASGVVVFFLACFQDIQIRPHEIDYVLHIRFILMAKKMLRSLVVMSHFSNT